MDLNVCRPLWHIIWMGFFEISENSKILANFQKRTWYKLQLAATAYNLCLNVFWNACREYWILSKSEWNRIVVYFITIKSRQYDLSSKGTIAMSAISSGLLQSEKEKKKKKKTKVWMHHSYSIYFGNGNGILLFEFPFWRVFSCQQSINCRKGIDKKHESWFNASISKIFLRHWFFDYCRFTNRLARKKHLIKTNR